jgi:hypothetical protein
MAAMVAPMDGIAAAIRAGRLSFAFLEASPTTAGGDDFAFSDLGERRRKGFSAPVRLLEARRS